MIVVQRPIQLFASQPAPQQVIANVLSAESDSGAADFPKFQSYVRGRFSTTVFVFLGNFEHEQLLEQYIGICAYLFHFLFASTEIPQDSFLISQTVLFLQQFCRQQIPLSCAFAGRPSAAFFQENSNLTRAAMAAFTDADGGATLHLSVFCDDLCVFCMSAGPFCVLHQILRTSAQDFEFQIACTLPMPREPVGTAPQRYYIEQSGERPISKDAGSERTNDADIFPQEQTNFSRGQSASSPLGHFPESFARGRLRFSCKSGVSVLAARLCGAGNALGDAQFVEFLSRQEVRELIQVQAQKFYGQMSLCSDEFLIYSGYVVCGSRLQLAAGLAAELQAALVPERLGAASTFPGGYRASAADGAVLLTRSQTRDIDDVLG